MSFCLVFVFPCKINRYKNYLSCRYFPTTKMVINKFNSFCVSRMTHNNSLLCISSIKKKSFPVSFWCGIWNNFFFNKPLMKVYVTIFLIVFPSSKILMGMNSWTIFFFLFNHSNISTDISLCYVFKYSNHNTRIPGGLEYIWALIFILFSYVKILLYSSEPYFKYNNKCSFFSFSFLSDSLI